MGWKIGTFVFGAITLVGTYFGSMACLCAFKDYEEANRLRKRNAQLVDALNTSCQLNAEAFPIAAEALQSIIETS